MNVIRFIYTVFIGLLFAAFVGFGIAAFYKAPAAPEYPAELRVVRSGEETEPQFEQLTKLQEEYDRDQNAYKTEIENYSRNVSIIAIGFAIAILIISLTTFRSIDLIADGLLLGGVFTLVYSIIRGIGSGSDMFRFLLVAAALIMSIALGYIRLVKKDAKKR